MPPTSNSRCRIVVTALLIGPYYEWKLSGHRFIAVAPARMRSRVEIRVCRCRSHLHSEVPKTDTQTNGVHGCRHQHSEDGTSQPETNHQRHPHCERCSTTREVCVKHHIRSLDRLHSCIHAVADCHEEGEESERT